MSHTYAIAESVSAGCRPIALLELFRRVALIVGVLGAVWCTLAPAPVVIRLGSVDFAKEQRQPGRTAADPAARGKAPIGAEEEVGSGAKLPLDEFIARQVKDRLVVVSGAAWEKLFADIKATESGKSADLIDHLGYRTAANYFYFPRDAAPASELLAQLSPGQSFAYIKLSGGDTTSCLSAVLQGPGDATRYAPEWIMHPLWPLAAWFAAAGILIYTFLPWPKASPSVLMYSGPRAVVLPDLLGIGLGAFFFALPLLIIADNQMSAGALPLLDFGGSRLGWLTIILWGFTSLCLSINAVAMWFGASCVQITEDALVWVSFLGTRRAQWSQIESAEGVAFRAPRWRRLLMMFCTMLSPRRAGAMIPDASAEGWGMRINLRDGRRYQVMLSHLPGAGRVVTRMIEHGVHVSTDLKASLPDDPYDVYRIPRPSRSGRLIGMTLAALAVAALMTWHFMPIPPATLVQPEKAEVTPEQVERQEAALKEIADLRAKMKALMARIDAAPIGERKEMLKEYHGFVEQVQKLTEEFSTEK